LSGGGQVAGIKDGVQHARIDVITGGYKSDTTQLKAGVPVSLQLVTNNTQGCSRAFTIPSLNYSQVLPATGEETIEFTPTEKGRLAYTCSMGMYTGYFDVI
jgi:plastocyanin domain-containing protein